MVIFSTAREFSPEASGRKCIEHFYKTEEEENCIKIGSRYT